MYRNEKSSMLTRDDVMVNAEIGCKLGKRRNLSLSLGVANIFNQVSYLDTILESNYLQTTNTSYLGRYGYLKVYFEF